MVMKLNRKIIRTMMEHKSQYLGSAMLILFSCLLFSAFNIMGVNVVGSLADFKRYNVQEDVSFVVQPLLSDTASLERDYNLVLEERGAADFAYDENATIRILSKTEKIDKYAVTGGKDMAKPGDMLIDPGFAEAHDMSIGDTVTAGGTAFKVVGFLSEPDYIYPLRTESEMVKSPDTFGIAVVSKDDFIKLGAGYVFYSVKFNEDNRDDFIKHIETNGTIIKWVNSKDNMRIAFIEGDIKGLGPMGKVLPVVILLLTCVLVAVVMWRLLKRELTQVGVLYALGYKKREILAHYLLYAVIISAIGGVIGTAAGAFLQKPFMTFITSFYNLPVLHFEYQFKYLVFSVLLPFVFLLPVTAAVVMRALALSPRELIAGGAAKNKINFLEKKLRLNRFKFNTKFKVREIVRNISRTLLMILGVTFASALLLLGFSMNDSMGDLTHSYQRSFVYKYSYMYNTVRTGTPVHGEAAMPAPFISERTRNADSTIMIYGVQPDSSMIRLTDREGSVLGLDETVITSALADRLDIRVGELFPVKSRLTSAAFDVTVDAIADYSLGQAVYMPIDRFNELCGYPAGSYIMLYSDEKLDIPPAVLLSEMKSSDMVEGFDAMMRPLRAISGVIGAVAFAIGLIVIYVVTSLIIEENRQSISLMKILGYREKELYNLILNTNTVFVLLGFVLSIPLIYYSMGAFFDVMTAEMNVDIPARISAVNVGIGFVFVFLTYEIAKRLNRKKITRINMAESLKNTME